MKRKYSGFTLREALELIPADVLIRWELPLGQREPSANFQENRRRLEAFDLENSEQARILLMDAIFAEIVPEHPQLKIWKAAPLETDTLTGVADYLIAPKRAFVITPLLCVAEAKKDDFLQGRAQCLAEMAACRWNNQKNGHEIDIFGIVSNGTGWQFYKLTPQGEVFESGLYSIKYLPELLAALDYLCTECAKHTQS